MGRVVIKSSYSITIKVEASAKDVGFNPAEMQVFARGSPSTAYLVKSSIVRYHCIAFTKGKYIAALCATPSVLASLDLLEGKLVTSGIKWKGGGTIVIGEGASVAGILITAQEGVNGIPFVLKFLEKLVNKDTADRIAWVMSYIW